MSEWKEYKLGDIINVKHGFAFKGKYITSEKNNNILVTPGNFHIGGGFKSDKFKYFTNKFPDEYILNADDIIVTMTDLSIASDTLGYSAKIPKSIHGEKYLHNQRIGLVEFKTQNVSKDYIYWLMRTREYQSFIINSASGTSIMHTAPKRICEYEFLLPPLPEQTAIASILSSLDDKIDLLHRQNETLERMAETLFRQWFVEEAEEDWEEKELQEFGSIICGKTPSKKHSEYFDGDIPFIKIPDMHGKTFVFDTQDSLTKEGYNSQLNKGIPEYSINVSCIATVGLVTMNVFRSQTNQQINTIIPKEGYRYYLYCEMKNSYDLLHSMASGGTATLNLNTGNFSKIKISDPDINTLNKFNSKVSPLFNKIYKNSKQIRTLTQLRDTLLPQLMNGEVRVDF